MNLKMHDKIVGCFVENYMVFTVWQSYGFDSRYCVSPQHVYFLPGRQR